MNDGITNSLIRDNLFIEIKFGRELLDEMVSKYGKIGWNYYIDRLEHHRISNIDAGHSNCMPVSVRINFIKEDFQGVDLSNMNFSNTCMTECCFEGGDLSHCKIGSVADSSFKNANLSMASFHGDISGASFAYAMLDCTNFKDAIFDTRRSPVHLPIHYLGSCNTYPFQIEDSDCHKSEPISALPPASVELCSFYGDLR
jgi:hypothetical protein